MSKLRAPVGELLSSQVEEATVQRVWAGVRARRAARLAKRLPARLARWGFAAVAALFLLLFVSMGWRGSAGDVSRKVASGPIVLITGGAVAALGSEKASENKLSDGSSIVLDGGSRLEVLENTSETFASVLRSGRAAFSVQPGGPRRWTVEVGLATVEVVGTRFRVARSPKSVDISVDHGTVLVRSDLIADRVQRLTAGQQLTIRVPAPVEPSLAPPTEPVAPQPASPTPLASARPSLDQLLVQANDHRRQGNVRAAEAALRLALSEHGGESQAALAAFSLGKLLLDTAGRPSEAAQAFVRCLALSPPKALAEDALFRLAEAQAAAGDLERAAITAHQYRAQYPGGRHTDKLQRWLRTP